MLDSGGETLLLNLPPTFFTSQSTSPTMTPHNSHHAMLTISRSKYNTNIIAHTHSVSSPHRRISTQSIWSESTTLEDSLCTIYNTTCSSLSNTQRLVNLSTHDIPFIENTIPGCSSYPSTSNQTFFSELPQALAITPSYHIKEAPNIKKITNYFNPLPQKRKTREEEGEGERNIDTNEKEEGKKTQMSKKNKRIL